MFTIPRRTRVPIARMVVMSLAAASVPARAQGTEKPKNLKVLSPDRTRDSVVKFMRYVVASGLGVPCSF